MVLKLQTQTLKGKEETQNSDFFLPKPKLCLIFSRTITEAK